VYSCAQIFTGRLSVRLTMIDQPARLVIEYACSARGSEAYTRHFCLDDTGVHYRAFYWLPLLGILSTGRVFVCCIASYQAK